MDRCCTGRRAVASGGPQGVTGLGGAAAGGAMASGDNTTLTGGLSKAWAEPVSRAVCSGGGSDGSACVSAVPLQEG